MKSKTKIIKQAKRKTNPELVKTILTCKKHPAWLKVASLLSRPRRKQIKINLDKINEKTKEGDTIVVPGKVLGTGNVDKKLRVAAFSFSKSAREKLKKMKGEVVSIVDEIKINPEAKGVKLIE